MNSKMLLSMLFIAMVVFASGCIQQAADDGTGSTDQTDQASEQEIIENLGNEMVDESEIIDIGELV